MTDLSKTMPPKTKPVLKTSIMTEYRKHPLEITVRFLRFANVGYTAYQRGQSCGLLCNVADPLVRSGKCEPADDASRKILEDYRRRLIDFNN